MAGSKQNTANLEEIPLDVTKTWAWIEGSSSRKRRTVKIQSQLHCFGFDQCMFMLVGWVKVQG